MMENKHTNEKLYKLKETVDVKIKNQKVVADLMGISLSHLSKILNGTRPCKKPIAYMIVAINNHIYTDEIISEYFEQIK